MQGKGRDVYFPLPDLEPGEYAFYVEGEVQEDVGYVSFIISCYGASDTRFPSFGHFEEKNDFLTNLMKDSLPILT